MKLVGEALRRQWRAGIAYGYWCTTPQNRQMLRFSTRYLAAVTDWELERYWKAS